MQLVVAFVPSVANRSAVTLNISIIFFVTNGMRLPVKPHGSTFMNLSKQELHRLAVPHMPLEMQQRLGMFLSEAEHERVNYEQWANAAASTPFDDLVRIVARIEALAGRVAEAQRLRSRAIGTVEALVATEEMRVWSEEMLDDALKLVDVTSILQEGDSQNGVNPIIF
ncbi:MAG: hypothetical protein R2911_14865 [Caldilineaceae bacterium]